MKYYQKIQLLADDTMKEIKEISDIIEKSSTADYKAQCEEKRIELSKQLMHLRSLLSMQGFDFGLMFTRTKDEITNFGTWFNLMNQEVDTNASV